MRKPVVVILLLVAIACVCGLAIFLNGLREPADVAERTSSDRAKSAVPEKLTIVYPLDGAVFPPEIAAPTFRWEVGRIEADGWRVTFEFHGEEAPKSFECDAAEWTPPDSQWEEIKRLTREQPAIVTVSGYERTARDRILSQGSVSISTSKDEVGAPLFFREVNLPFLTAVKNPALHIRWRFGEISSKGPPPIVLDKLPVCGNCHSFAADGSTLAMEVDSGNDKGAYAVLPVEEQISINSDKIVTWSDYRPEDGTKTFGLLCQISPDGQHVVGTVKDRALAVYRPDLAFSQLFFLVKGILATYDRGTESFSALPGADDPDYVQTNATWSPDGKTIVFARSCSEVYDPPGLREFEGVLVPEKFARVFTEDKRQFKYDLYRIPFNDGKGGKAEPIPGASNNGMSNYFPKFSPDGKWIIFCKAASYMLLQPDSELYIIPAEGGEARRLRCNMGRMNSWHSWSPNGKWLVFSSKAYSVYTQLFLTHIDEQGRSTPPVVLSNFTEENRAANIPEFANVKPDAIVRIHEEFLDDTSYARAGDAFRLQDEPDNAIEYYRKAVEYNPKNALALANWGDCLLQKGNPSEAKDLLDRAIALEPDLAVAHRILGLVFMQQDQLEEARDAFREAVQLDPDYALAHRYLGIVSSELGELDVAETHLTEATRLDPHDSAGRYGLAVVLAKAKKPDQAVAQLTRTLKKDPEFVPALIALATVRATSPDESLRNVREAAKLASRACELTRQQDPEALRALAVAQAELGQFVSAESTARRAAQAARAAGNPDLAEAIQQAFQHLHQKKPGG